MAVIVEMGDDYDKGDDSGVNKVLIQGNGKARCK